MNKDTEKSHTDAKEEAHQPEGSGDLTVTDKAQLRVEGQMREIFQEIQLSQQGQVSTKISYDKLLKDKHAHFLMENLRKLQYSSKHYDNGQPWVVYWITHALEMLNLPEYQLDLDLQNKIIQYLSRCQFKLGGFTGGPHQYPQLASTYAAILSILITGNEEAYKIINRKTMYDFLLKMKQEDGSFTLAYLGEVDMRGIYIAALIMDALNIKSKKLADKIDTYIQKCQTYEGGIGPQPHSEAHGGLTYCAVAALCILKKLHCINIVKLLNWLKNRQMKMELGFQGRTNKLVDACYSFWVGAVFKLLSDSTDQKLSHKNYLLMNQDALQAYIYICQDTSSGGLKDKPDCPADFYHTCYALSGLSIAQRKTDNQFHMYTSGKHPVLQEQEQANKLEEIDPIYNISKAKVEKAKAYFSKLEPISDEN